MAITGLERTYDIIGRREDLEDTISMISPEETPLTSSMNVVTVKNTKHEWIEDALAAMSATLTTALASDTDSVSATVDTGEGARFRADSSLTPVIKEIIRIDEEIMLVTDEAANVLTVTRAYAGSSVALHAADSTIEILGPVDLEGADAKSAEAQTRSRAYNYTQPFYETVQVSTSQLASLTAGVVDEGNYQLQNKLKELAIKLERFMINGRQSATAGGSATVERLSRGLLEFISTNTSDKSGAVFTEGMLEDMLQTCWDAGGHPNIIMANSYQARKIQDWYKGRLRVVNANDVPGGIKVQEIESIFGNPVLMLNRWVPKHEVYVLDGSKIALGSFIPFRSIELARSGASVKLFIEGEYTLVLKNESSHYRMYNLATS